MALSLRVWLHDEVKTQLALAHSWFEDKNKLKAELDRPAARVDRKWEGLYHDNGSCIDIVGPLSSGPAQVLVLQTNPLTITDGLHHIDSSLTSACLNGLRTRNPGRRVQVASVLAVRKYVIRYTSYGPPRDKLRFILDTVEWVGDLPSKLCAHFLTKPLRHSDDIASTLRQLHDARVQDDDRCLRLQPRKEEDLEEGAYTMAGADGPTDEDASMNTQMPFGTQEQHPIRPRRGDDEVSIVGINRMEPVLAGNTQRAELKPRSGNSMSEQQKQAQLLSLIHKIQLPATPPAQTYTHAHSTPEPRPSRGHAATTSPRPRETPSKRANVERIEEELSASSTQTPSDMGKKRMQETENESPSMHHSSTKASFSENEPKQSNASEMDRFAEECSWMKGLKLNRAASIIPEDQAYILQKPESWHKPQVGQRFPGANIPVQTFITLSRLADEKAALEGATSSGSTNEPDPSTGSYPPTSAPEPEHDQGSEPEEEVPTSPVSWHTSPTPPPQRPMEARHSLPPDSSASAEEPRDVAESALVQKLGARRDQSPHSTLPASSDEDQVDLPPSSPPTVQTAQDSDDDMELEISVPQALGEDQEVPTVSRPVQTEDPRIASRTRPVVQEKETPYMKGKNGQQPVATISPPTQKSNNHLDNSSSTSIVQGTYQEMSSSAVEETRLDALHRINHKEQRDHADMGVSIQPGHVQGSAPALDAEDVAMFDIVRDESLLDLAWQPDRQAQALNMQTGTIQAKAPAQPEPTPMSAQLAPKDSSSGEQPVQAPAQIASAMPLQLEREPSRQPSSTPSLTKRKLETTPTRERRRPSKYRRLKIVSFAGGNSEALQQQRAESLRRSETERRKLSTSVESRQGSVSDMSVQQDAGTKTEDSDVKETIKPQVEEPSAVVEGSMSPRHQSLYAAPSPILRPSAAPRVAASITETVSIDETEQDTPEAVPTRQGIADNNVRSQQTEVPSQSKSPPRPQSEPQSEHRLDQSRPVPVSTHEASQPSLQVPARAEQIDAPAPMTVFEAFKNAYPEYQANITHFKNQCTQMEALDREDRMVPKWMWDDFIIRNWTDFREYAAERLDAGEEYVPYIHFYKDTIRDAIYKKGIIETRAVLLKALHELGVRPSKVDSPSPQPPIQQAVQQPSQQPPRPLVRQSTHVRQPDQPSVQHSPRRPIQQSPGLPAQGCQSPMPPSAQSAITPPKKKPSRKSLPFQPPSHPTSDRINGTPRVRHSLPASSSRAVPTSSPAPKLYARPSSGARPKRKSEFGDKLRRLAAELKEETSSTLEKETGNEVGDWARATPRLTSTTGSTRVDPQKPWPSKLEVRTSVRDLPKKRIDVLSWTDEL